jgi:hypothetical protein
MGPYCFKINGGNIRQSRNSPSPTVEGKPKVFISFDMDDRGMVELLRNQAKESDTLDFYDNSLQEPFTEKWKTNITPIIGGSALLIAAVGEKTHTSPAVEWEIEKAYELGVPVIGMRLHSERQHILPKPLRDHNAKIVPWNLEEIQKAIDAKAISKAQPRPKLAYA